MRRASIIATVAAAGVGLGVWAETRSGAGVELVADLLTGWTLLACGVWGLWHRPDRWRWALVASSGLTWFLGNFATTSGLVHLHRGPLVHAVVAASGARSRPAVATIAAGYGAAVLLGRAGGWVTAGVVAMLVVLAVRRRQGPVLAGSSAALAVGLGLAASTALLDVTSTWTGPALHVYEAALAASAVLLVVAAVQRGRVRRGVSDLVVELGPAQGMGSIRDALARILGDPRLAVGFWLPDERRYVDGDGNPFPLPVGDPRRATTVVDHDGHRVAALVHDAALVDDRALLAAVREAAGLMLANDRLRAEAEARLIELRASRERILTARDDQRRRLAARLNDRVEHPLGRVAAAVQRTRAEADADQDRLLDLLAGELAVARDELRELAHGLHPRVLVDEGLAAALGALAGLAPVPVAVTAPEERLPLSVEIAAYFVCSEALANVAKHAHASCVDCSVLRRDGAIVVTVRDDGVGGAGAGGGSGLRGLADRVGVLGGRLAITSPPGEGTTLTATLPLGALPS